MTERKPDTSPDWVDPDDAPEWTDEMFDHAAFSVGDKVIRPATGVLTKNGMRPLTDFDGAVTIRLPPEVFAYFQDGGPDSEARIVEALKQYVSKEG